MLPQLRELVFIALDAVLDKIHVIRDRRVEFDFHQARPVIGERVPDVPVASVHVDAQELEIPRDGCIRKDCIESACAPTEIHQGIDRHHFVVAGIILPQLRELVFIALDEDRLPAAIVDQRPRVTVELTVPGTEFDTPFVLDTQDSADFFYQPVFTTLRRDIAAKLLQGGAFRLHPAAGKMLDLGHHPPPPASSSSRLRAAELMQ